MGLIKEAGTLLGSLLASQLLPRPELWRRQNYHGRDVSLSGGVAAAAAVTLGSAAGGFNGIPVALTAGTAGYFGYKDDTDAHAGSAKGFSGHIAALKKGEFDTGMQKVLGIGLSALGSAAICDARRRQWRMIPVDTVVIAGMANLINLMDLRPGRALKATILAGIPFAVSAPVRTAIASAIGALPTDLHEETMLGDTGANALGAALGAGIVQSSPTPIRVAIAIGIIGLTAASEKVSFTRVIESNQVLSSIDNWGREPI